MEIPLQLTTVMAIYTHSLGGEGGFPSSYDDDKWPPFQELPSSMTTLSCISATCGQFCCKPSIRFSGLSREPKMPSSGHKLKSQLGTKKGNWAENSGSPHVSWEPGWRAAEHHGTLCAGVWKAGTTPKWLTQETPKVSLHRGKSK